MPKAMWWFRWSSVVTVLAGISYWNMIVATDANNAIANGQAASAGRVIGSFFVIWTVAFVVEMGLLMSPAEGLRKGSGIRDDHGDRPCCCRLSLPEPE